MSLSIFTNTTEKAIMRRPLTNVASAINYLLTNDAGSIFVQNKPILSTVVTNSSIVMATNSTKHSHIELISAHSAIRSLQAVVIYIDTF